MQLDKFAGHYDWMSLYGEQGGSPYISINIPEAAFSGVTFNKVGKKIKFLLMEKMNGCDFSIIFKIILF